MTERIIGIIAISIFGFISVMMALAAFSDFVSVKLLEGIAELILSFIFFSAARNLYRGLKDLTK